MPKLKPLKLVLAGVDRISAPVERINRKIDRLARPIRTVTNRLRILNRAAGMATLRKSVMAATVAVRGLASSVFALGSRLMVIGGIIGFGFVRALSKITETGDEIAKTADNLGMAIDEFQALEQVASLSGISSEKFRKSMGRLSKSVGDALRGSIEAKFAFDTLGVSIVDSSGEIKTHAVLLGDLAEGFKRVTSPTLKAFFAQTLFSRSGARMVKMLDLGREGIDAAVQRAKDLGVMGEKLARESERWVDNWTEIKFLAKGLAYVFAGPLVSRLVHGTHAAAAELFSDPIRSQKFEWRHGKRRSAEEANDQGSF